MDALASILTHAKNHCEYYQNIEPGDAHLEQFPVINRSIIKADADKLLTLKSEARASLLEVLNRGLPLQPNRTVSEFRFSNDIFIEQTSGSSGVPLRMPKTSVERSRLSLAAWRCRMKFDPLIDIKTFLPLFHRSLDSPLPVSPFDSSPAGVSKFYNWLKENNFRWIHAPPALINYHAKILRSTHHQMPAPALKFIEVSGSPPEEDTITAIKDVLGAKVINQYGTRETWAIGYAEGLNAFDINSEAVHVELLDDNNKPIIEADIEGAVTITSKVLRLLPIIRYKTGDRGCWQNAQGEGERHPIRRLKILPERDINMLFFNGKWLSGNILFKDVLHKIDHSIGYGYAKYMQIRKTGQHDWHLIVCQCDQPIQIFDELRIFLLKNEPRSQLKMTIIPEMEGKLLAERKPYLFVNEWNGRGLSE